MKENRLTVRIQRPASSVFDFTTDPGNTPLWIDSILSEVVDDTPVKIGTRYTNINKDGIKNIYAVSQFVAGEVFELVSIPRGYAVRYSYTPISLTETELEYFEWVEQGELEAPFTQ